MSTAAAAAAACCLLTLALAPATMSAFDAAPVNQRCSSCSVFTFINSRLLCANPSTCHADFCYAYLLSDGRTMFLSGCAEQVSDFPIGKREERLMCHTRGAVGLCICRAGECGDVATSTANLTRVAWINTESNAINRVTGFSADYARSRVGQMHVENYPETFPGQPLMSATSSSPIFAALAALVAPLLIT